MVLSLYEIQSSVFIFYVGFFSDKFPSTVLSDEPSSSTEYHPEECEMTDEWTEVYSKRRRIDNSEDSCVLMSETEEMLGPEPGSVQDAHEDCDTTELLLNSEDVILEDSEPSVRCSSPELSQASSTVTPPLIIDVQDYEEIIESDHPCSSSENSSTANATKLTDQPQSQKAVTSIPSRSQTMSQTSVTTPRIVTKMPWGSAAVKTASVPTRITLRTSPKAFKTNTQPVKFINNTPRPISPMHTIPTSSIVSPRPMPPSIFKRTMFPPRPAAYQDKVGFPAYVRMPNVPNSQHDMMIRSAITAGQITGPTRLSPGQINQMSMMNSTVRQMPIPRVQTPSSFQGNRMIMMQRTTSSSQSTFMHQNFFSLQGPSTAIPAQIGRR